MFVSKSRGNFAGSTHRHVDLSSSVRVMACEFLTGDGFFYSRSRAGERGERGARNMDTWT